MRSGPAADPDAGGTQDPADLRIEGTHPEQTAICMRIAAFGATSAATSATTFDEHNGGYRVQAHVELSPSVTKRRAPGCSFAGNLLTVDREQ